MSAQRHFDIESHETSVSRTVVPTVSLLLLVLTQIKMMDFGLDYRILGSSVFLDEIAVIEKRPRQHIQRRTFRQTTFSFHQDEQYLHGILDLPFPAQHPCGTQKTKSQLLETCDVMSSMQSTVHRPCIGDSEASQATVWIARRLRAAWRYRRCSHEDRKAFVPVLAGPGRTYGSMLTTTTTGTINLTIVRFGWGLF